MKYAAICLHFDSMSEAAGFPPGYSDAAFLRASDRFLALADKLGFKYSIYVVGRDLENPRHRELVREWSRQGHEIGNHSWSHPIHLGSMSKPSIQREIERAHELITETTGREPRGFIAPGWSVSPQVLQVLMELRYLYDASPFPSWLMYPMLARILLNHIGSRTFFTTLLKILRRPDLKASLVGSRNVSRVHSASLRGSPSGDGITVMPVPTTRFRVACWHTLAFAIGWARHERTLRSCLNEIGAFHYDVHPADLLERQDLPTSHPIYLERLDVPLAEKRAYLERAIGVILSSGRTIITMEELASRYERDRLEIKFSRLSSGYTR